MGSHFRQFAVLATAVALTGWLVCGCGGGGEAPPTGQVEGRVVDADTSSGVYPATVNVGTRSTGTQADGSYSMNVPLGTHDLTVAATGYLPFPAPADPPYSVAISQGLNVIPDILLVPTGPVPPPPPP